jgi:hypothetical protein
MLSPIGTLRAVATAALALAPFVSAFADPQPRPRLWLGATTMSRLQAARTAVTPEWTNLKNWCDANLGNDLREGYQYLDWYSYIHAYGLMYRVTGDVRYGNKGVVYLKGLLRDRHVVGDALGGVNAVRIDSGYVTRSLGVGVAVGRDWLDGAPDLTPELIAECTTRMNDWLPWVHSSAYAANEPTINYFAGHFAMTYTAFISFEGDPGYQPSWETKSASMWSDMRDTINTTLRGGDWTEGWNYGGRAVRHIMGYPWAIETGTDRPSEWGDINFSSELIRAHVAMLHPARDRCSDDGRWTGDYKGDPRSTTCLMMSILPDTDATAKGLAAWYAGNLAWEPGSPDRWEAFLYTDPSILPIVPTDATMPGLTYRMTGHAVSRGDDWSNLDATFVDVVARPDFEIEPNFGEVKLASRRKPLLVDGNTWQLGGQYANMPRIAGNHTYAPYQEYWHLDSEMQVESVDRAYTYHKLTNLYNLYNGRDADNPSVDAFQREIVFLPPDLLIVHDHILPQTLANTITEQWYLMGDPVIDGDTARVDNGDARLFARTFANSTVTLSEFNNNATRAGTHRLDVAFSELQSRNLIFTFFEAADRTQVAMTPTEILHVPGLRGFHFQDSTDPIIAFFPSQLETDRTAVTFRFRPIAPSTRVFLSGMRPEFFFDIAITPIGEELEVVVEPGTTEYSGHVGGFHFVVDSPSAIADWEMY